MAAAEETVVLGPEPEFKPIVSLPEVETRSGEEDEEVTFTIRAKLFRFVTETNEWKERGVGECRLLRHRKSQKIRLLMRRDKTLKLCANHYVLPHMKLEKNATSDRSWVWTVAADFSEDTPTSELLAIRFANAENAKLFKEHFEKAREVNAALYGGAVEAEEKKEEKEEKKDDEEAKLAEKLAEVKVEEKD